MSSNCAEKSASCAPPASSRAAWSLTLWLTLFNTCSAFLILSTIAALLYGALSYQLMNQNHLYLHEELTIIEGLARTRGNDEALIRELGSGHSGLEYVKHFIRLMDRNGRVVLETPRMGELVPAEAFPLPTGEGLPGVDRTWRSPSGNLILSTMVRVDQGKGPGKEEFLQVALDVTNVDNILVAYRHWIFLSLVAGFMLCLLVSLAISRRGTRPLREMTEVMRGITVSNLEERVAGANWPRELNVLADALNLMLDRLQDSFARLHNSARNLTHKMRTPLTIMRGEAEVALSRERSVEELREVIVSSLEEHNRLSRLGDNILFLANADMGTFVLARQEIEAGTEIEKVVDFYSLIAQEKGVDLIFRGSAVLYLDAPLFRKAAAALISNAFTYNSAGGTVVIEVRQGKDGSGELSVTDSGCGIAADELQKVFDRFYRVYATRHVDPHGTGLGLPIAKAIMELHGGTIEVRSQPDQGTTVTLKFTSPAI